MEKIWLSAQEAADEIGVHVETIRRLIRNGAIKAIRLSRGPKAHWRIHRDDWRDWLKNQLQNEL